MAKMGRPRKEIGKDEFEKLCGLQCSKWEIAGWFDVSEDTIDRFCKREYGESFAVVRDKKGALGRISIRRMQFKLAEKNAAMAIFLGKQYLGQRDVIQHEGEGVPGVVSIYLPDNQREQKEARGEAETEGCDGGD